MFPFLKFIYVYVNNLLWFYADTDTPDIQVANQKVRANRILWELNLEIVRDYI